MSENPKRWTVGQLREALAAYPDDTPLQVAVPIDGEPDMVEDRYVVVELGFGKSMPHGGGWVQNEFVTLELEDLDVS